CGAVKFEFDTDPTFVAVCHCLDCKKASGGEAATFFGVPEDDFTLISGEPKAFHYIAQSGNGLDRNFWRQGVQQQPELSRQIPPGRRPCAGSKPRPDHDHGAPKQSMVGARAAPARRYHRTASASETC